MMNKIIDHAHSAALDLHNMVKAQAAVISTASARHKNTALNPDVVPGKEHQPYYDGVCEIWQNLVVFCDIVIHEIEQSEKTFNNAECNLYEKVGRIASFRGEELQEVKFFLNEKNNMTVDQFSLDGDWLPYPKAKVVAVKEMILTENQRRFGENKSFSEQNKNNMELVEHAQSIEKFLLSLLGMVRNSANHMDFGSGWEILPQALDEYAQEREKVKQHAENKRP